MTEKFSGLRRFASDVRVKYTTVALLFIGLLAGGHAADQLMSDLVTKEVEAGRGFKFYQDDDGSYRVHLSYAVAGRLGNEASGNALRSIRLRCSCEIGNISERFDNLTNPGVDFIVTTQSS